MMSAILSVLAAVSGFFITFYVSNFFIAPVEHRRKSRFAILMLKLSMAGGVAIWVFFIVVTFLTGGKE